MRYGRTRKSGSTGVMTKRLPSKKNKQQLKTKHNEWVSKYLVSMKKRTFHGHEKHIEIHDKCERGEESGNFNLWYLITSYTYKYFVLFHN